MKWDDVKQILFIRRCFGIESSSVSVEKIGYQSFSWVWIIDVIKIRV